MKFIGLYLLKIFIILLNNWQNINYGNIIPKNLHTVWLNSENIFEVGCIDSFAWNMEFNEITVYDNKLILPEYWFWIKYMSINPCNIDEKSSNWINNDWSLNPQWWQNNNKDEVIGNYKPCERTPVKIYSYSGDIYEILRYFAVIEWVPYKELKYNQLKWDFENFINELPDNIPSNMTIEQYLKDLRYIWDSVVSWLKDWSIELFWWNNYWYDTRFMDPYNVSHVRLLMHKLNTNYLISFQVYWEECWMYRQDNILEVLE